MNIILFIVIYFFITNWVRLRYTLGNIIKNFMRSGEKPTLCTDKKLLTKYKKKTGLEFQIKIVKSDFISGAMAGVPFWPMMILSDKVFSDLKEDERDWLICHEAGHCVKWHVVQTMLFWLLVLVIGGYIVSYYQLSNFQSILLGLISSIVFYQLERYFSEYQADLYALNNVDSLDGMIRANQKMKKRVKSIFYKNKVLTFLFTPHLSYDQRIQMAYDRKN